MTGIILKLVKYWVFMMLAMIPLLWLSFGIIATFILPEMDISVVDRISISIHPILVYAFIRKLNRRFFSTVIITSLFIIAETEIIRLTSKFKMLSSFDHLFFIILCSNAILWVILSLWYFLFQRKPKKVSKNIKSKSSRTKATLVFKANPENIYLDNPYRGIYVQGGSGSGKSESILKPIIKQNVKKGFSGVIYDFKSPVLTNYMFHYSLKYKSSITPYIVDFKEPRRSHRINPLAPEYLYKFVYAFEYAEVIINNLLPETILKREYWDRDAQSILTGLIWFLKKHHPELCTLPHIIALILTSDTEALLGKINSDPETAGMIASLKQAIDRKVDKQVAGVISTLQTALARLNNAEVFWLLSGNDLNLNINDTKDPKLLCIGNDESIPSAYTPAISLIISVCGKIMNQQKKHPSFLLLDEAPTLYLPNFELIPATGRSNKISVIFGAQDYSQLVDKYGNHKAQVILSNLGSQFFGRSSLASSAEMVKNLFSKQDKTFWSKTKNTGSSGTLVHFNTNDGKGKSQSIQERDRVKTNDIILSDKGQFYGIIAEGKPREFLNSKFEYDQTELDQSYIKAPLASQSQIDNNFLKINQEVQDLFKPKNHDDLIEL